MNQLLSIALLVGLMVLVVRMRCRRTARIALFVGFAGILLISRLQSIFFPLELNPDESHLLALGLRMMDNPIPWVGFDGTTSGPMNVFLAGLAWALPGEAPYSSLRILAFLSVLATSVVYFCAAARLLGFTKAVFVTMPLAFFYAITRQADFVHFSSEVLPNLLISIQVLIIAIVVSGLPTTRKTGYLLFFAGVIPALVFFAKLQAVPAAAVCFLTTLAVLWCSSGSKAFVKGAGWAALGGCVGGGLILGPVAMAGGLGEFYVRYIEFALHHKSPTLGFHPVTHMRDLFWSGWEGFTACLAALTGLLVAVGLPVLRKRNLCHVSIVLVAGSVLNLAVVIYSIIKTQQVFPHYINLLIPAVQWSVICAFFFLDKNGYSRRTFQLNSFVAINIVVFLALTWVYPGRISPRMDSSRAFRASDEIVNAIKASNRPLAVWGWAPHYYVLSGLAPAGRDTILHTVLTKSSRQDSYLRALAADWREARPEFILDSVAENNQTICPEWGSDLEGLRAANSPYIQDILRESYELVGTYGAATSKQPQRLYRLKKTVD